MRYTILVEFMIVNFPAAVVAASKVFFFFLSGLFQVLSVLHKLRTSSVKQAPLKSNVGDCVLQGVFGKKLMRENYLSWKSRSYRNLERNKNKSFGKEIWNLYCFLLKCIEVVSRENKKTAESLVKFFSCHSRCFAEKYIKMENSGSRMLY